MLLSDAINYTKSHRDSWINGSGAVTALINANHALRILGDIELTGLETKHFTQIREQLLSEDSSASKINQVFSALTTVVKELIAHGYKEHTVPGFKRMKIKNARPGFYTQDEIDRLLESSRGLSDSLLLHDSIYFSYKTGCRQEELLTLERQDVDFESMEICFRDTKNGEDHYLPISEALLPVLERRFHQMIDARVFPWEGCRNGSQKLREEFRSLASSLDIDPSKLWHTIRHTTATHLVSKGAPLRVIMGVLNHKNVSTTLRYAKVADQSKKEALDLL